tara:strand:+ start:887 stop:1384 length:498 start_codon:yes stop_codon:yes gene_type:complete
LKVVIATARSGSSSFVEYLSRIYPNESIAKLLIHRITEDYKNIIKKYPEVFLLDRKDKLAQAESLTFRKFNYGDDFKYYHQKEYYDLSDIENYYIEEAKKYFEIQSSDMKVLSSMYNKKIIFYEDLFKDTKKVEELNIYNKRFYNEFLHPRHRSRLLNKPKKQLL